MIDLKLELDPSLERFIHEKIASGQYDDVQDVLRSALHVMRDQETLTREDVEELRREVAIGLDQLRRGEQAHFTAEDIQRRGREILAKRSERRP
jgi:antitoxin ParD1/3/4